MSWLGEKLGFINCLDLQTLYTALWIMTVKKSFEKFADRLVVLTRIYKLSTFILCNFLEHSVKLCSYDVILPKLLYCKLPECSKILWKSI